MAADSCYDACPSPVYGEGCYDRCKDQALEATFACYRDESRCTSENASRDRPAQGRTGNGGTTSCRPASDACELVMRRAEAYVLNPQHSIIPGMTEATSQAYCTSAVSFEAYNFCASEYEREGRANCAGLAKRQAEAYRVPMQTAIAAAIDSSADNARILCDFEIN